ncbi:GNAT family N-acetyltransferase [Nocardioides sp.]|uniref:GNAT family N-acetyltransferase n=1 Tax=Nocardioides sp. TaxID=35761 RepID=UPI0027338293|nr:GNAT family protein [Nocardioides sp.]MDP3894180.1 GNAT family protein [Nocardioides sp.]
MPQATLRTARLELVPLAENHLSFLIELNSDPVVHRFLSAQGLTPQESAEQLRHALTAAKEAPGLGQWVGSYRGEPIGLWMLQPPHEQGQPPRPREADLGYRLPQRHWRQGYASEGARELVRHGFEDLGLDRIFAQTMTVNQASRATMAAVGLRFVRTFVEEHAVPIPGHEQGEEEYDVTRERWSRPVDRSVESDPPGREVG